MPAKECCGCPYLTPMMYHGRAILGCIRPLDEGPCEIWKNGKRPQDESEQRLRNSDRVGSQVAVESVNRPMASPVSKKENTS